MTTVIVGAGSAGCVLAAFDFSEDPDNKGPAAGGRASDPLCLDPLCPSVMVETMWSPQYNWRFETDPWTPNMNGRRIYWPRRQDLGGSSSINGLIYVQARHRTTRSLGRAGQPGLVL